MIKNILKGLQLYYPDIYDDMKDYTETNFMEIQIELKNGDIYIYDDMDQSLRKLRRSYKDLDDDEYLDEFIYRLKRTMRLHCVSNKSLSEMTGIPASTISSYTQGKASPSMINIRKISRALNCDIQDLIF